MRPRHFGFGLGVFPGLLLLAACAMQAPSPKAHKPLTAPPNLTAPYAAAAARGTPVYRLDPDASQVLILVGKAGALAGLGHIHAVVVGDLHGFALATRQHGGRADVYFPVRALAVDPPAARSALGGDYAKTKMNPNERDGTRKHMLGTAVLDAAHYPRVELAILAPAVASDEARALTIRIRLRGVTRVLRAPAHYRVTPGRLRADGAFTLRQTEFGIQPYSALLGALRVKNTLRIRYHLVFHRWRP
ncbi:MAG: YceI family protein [Gammaproteobacteria bacterium]